MVVGLDKDGLELQFMGSYKGYGVITTKRFSQGDFLLEYVGERISRAEALSREKKYQSDRQYFLYFFKFNGKEHCIDATSTSGRLGNMVNDAPMKDTNSKMKMIIHKGVPRLCLFASTDLEIGDELFYDYGDNEQNLWWRQKKQQKPETYKELIESDVDLDPFDLNTSQEKKDETDLIESDVDLDPLGLNTSQEKNNDPDYIIPDTDESESDGSSDVTYCSRKRKQLFPCLNTFKKTRSEYSDESMVGQINDGCGQNNKESFEEEIGLFRKDIPKEGCRKRYDHINFCTFCGKGIQSKISRHILEVHKDHLRVRPILFKEKRSKERIAKLQLLVSEGNFKHNIHVLREGKGLLVTARRESMRDNTHDPQDYVPCEFCKIFYLKRLLWHHTKQCPVRLIDYKQNLQDNEEDNGNEHSKEVRNFVRRGQSLLHSAIMSSDENPIADLLARMHNDDMTSIVKRDSIIKAYATLKMESLGCKEDQKKNDVHRVSQSCRMLARLVLKAREQLPSTNLDQLIHSEKLDIIVVNKVPLSMTGK